MVNNNLGLNSLKDLEEGQRYRVYLLLVKRYDYCKKLWGSALDIEIFLKLKTKVNWF